MLVNKSMDIDFMRIIGCKSKYLFHVGYENGTLNCISLFVGSLCSSPTKSIFAIIQKALLFIKRKHKSIMNINEKVTR